jgi:hypothetical protein
MNTFQAAPGSPFTSSVSSHPLVIMCSARCGFPERPVGFPMLNALARTKCFSSLQNHRKLTHSDEEGFAWSREFTRHLTLRDIE